MSGVQQKSQGKQRDRKRGQFKGKTPTETCPWKTCVRACLVASDSAAPWAVARRAPLSMGFSRQEHWCGLPCPPSGDLPDPGIEPAFLYLLRWQVGSLPLASPGKPWERLNGRQILYSSTNMWYLELSNSQRQEVQWWLPGAKSGQSFSFISWKELWDWGCSFLHSNMTVFNTTDLYT